MSFGHNRNKEKSSSHSNSDEEGQLRVDDESEEDSEAKKGRTFYLEMDTVKNNNAGFNPQANLTTSPKYNTPKTPLTPKSPLTPLGTPKSPQPQQDLLVIPTFNNKAPFGFLTSLNSRNAQSKSPVDHPPDPDLQTSTSPGRKK